MNLKTMTLALVVTGVGVLAGCSSPSVIQQRDGTSTVTPDEPTYDKKSCMYEYDKDGKKVQINKDDVKSIEEVKYALRRIPTKKNAPAQAGAFCWANAGLTCPRPRRGSGPRARLRSSSPGSR